MRVTGDWYITRSHNPIYIVCFTRIFLQIKNIIIIN